MFHWRNLVPSGEAFHALRDAKSRRDPVRYHGHDFAEVFWIDAGRAVHRVNGGGFPLQPGSVVLMRPSDFHGIEPLAGKTIQMTNIAFSKETYDFLKKRYFGLAPWAFWIRDKYPAAWIVEPARLALFNQWADCLAQARRERLQIERFLLNLLAELSPRTEELPPDMPAWLLHACREITMPAHFSCGVEEFVRLASRSREHVARCTRHYLGLSPTQYVNRVRMGYAARQLQMGVQSILEIAADCGIGNLSHFYTLFRAEFGVTPRGYRLSHRKPL